MNAKGDIHSLGRQGVAYGFEGSMGFSRASSRAVRRTRLSSAERVGVGAGVGSVVLGAVGSEEGNGVGAAIFRREVSSRSWASRESVKPVEVADRERVRLKRR